MDFAGMNSDLKSEYVGLVINVPSVVHRSHGEPCTSFCVLESL